MKIRHKIVITLLSALIFILAFGFLLPKDSQKYLKERFYLQKAIAEPDFDIIVMGDSRAVNGVSPNIIESILDGYKVLNFGFSNGGLNPQIFKVAESKLNNSSKPKVIVLAITALTLHKISFNNEHYLSIINQTREQKLGQLYFTPIYYYFSPVTPNDVVNKISGIRIPWDDLNQIYHENGWIECATQNPDTSYALPFYKKDYDKSLVDYNQLDIISNQIRNWTSHGIKVVCFRPPTTIQMKKLEENMGKYDEKRVALAVQEAGALWVPFNFSEYESYDGSHLSGESAKRVSLKLAEAIKMELNK